MGDAIELVARGERRRRWSVEDKLRIVAETEASGATVREVARRHDVNPNLLYTWRRMAEGRPARPAAVGAQLVPVTIAEPALVAAPGRASGAAIEITLPGGVRVKVGEAVTPGRLAEVLAILRR
jgi:transposase